MIKLKHYYKKNEKYKNWSFRNKEAQELLKSWGLSFEKELVRINARKHQPEKILFGGVRTCINLFLKLNF